MLVDGIPVNDPSGFASDLYDIDCGTVRKIEVLRGPAAGLYGDSSAAAMINIITKNRGSKPLNGELSRYARNLPGEDYMAFTEPDPEGNSYQPGPSREFFGNIKINF